MKKNIFVLIISFLILKTVSFAQGGGLIIGNNFRIFPSATSQSEVFITNHPVNTNILFTSANTIQFSPTFFVSEGVYVSSDAGQTWYGSDTCKGANIFFHGGDPSIVIDKNGTFILTRKGSSSFPGVYSHYSTDNGITWSAQKTISTDDLERAVIVSDTDPNSTYYGRTYLVYALLTPPYPIKFSYSNNITSGWSAATQINNPIVRGAGGEVTLGPNQEVFACWAGVSNVSPFTEVQVGFASSTNGGTNWSVSENAFSMNGIVGILTDKQSIRVNGLPRMTVDLSNSSTRGNIYIVTSQKNLLPAGTDADIILRKSTDGGQSWSAGIRVNQDAVNNGKSQFFPGITVDDFGGVNIIFYDDRNTSIDSLGVFLARSTDGGNSWSEYEISDHNFRPTAIGGLGQGYMGDNIDITSIGNKLFPVWMDNSTGTYQIWSVPIEFTPIIDELPPVILEPIVVSDTSENSFTVSYNTERGGNSKIKYGLTNALELDSLFNNSISTSHILTVTELNDSTEYFFQVYSSNEFGQSSGSILSIITKAKKDSITLPTYFELKQNYPNPFNPNTTIEFSLPFGSNVSLKIFDITGKEVVSLIDEYRNTGINKINFETTKSNLSSGVYFYTLKANGFTQTKPMILLK